MMLSRICLSCDRKNAPDAKFCSECGAPLQLKICRHCHKTNDYLAHFCQSCGKPLPFAEPDSPAAEPSASGPTPVPAPPELVRADGSAGDSDPAPARVTAGTSTIVKAFLPPANAGPSVPMVPRNSVEDVTAPSVVAAVTDTTEQPGSTLPAVVSTPWITSSRRHGTRGAWLALGALVLVVVIAGGALVGRDRTIEPQPAQSEPKSAPPAGEVPTAARDAAAVAATVPAPAGSGETPPPPAQASAPPPDPQAERKDADPPMPVRRTQPAAADPVPAPRALASPRPAPVRECTAELAILGLCTLPDQPERK
jgi:ribosomal protein L40E